MTLLTRRSALACFGAALRAELPKDAAKRPADVDEAQIPSSLDSEAQNAWVLKAPKGAPLLVFLHSWSATYNHTGGLDEAFEECRKRGWGMISPDFRGPNNRPQACASRFAIRDVEDAVAFTRKRIGSDPRRIYLWGASGGGHMALTMAHSAPRLWAAVSSWVPISDLAEWHRFSKLKGARYSSMIEACCGGPPGSAATDAQYRARSPIFHLSKAARLPIDIQAGIHDGHTGSVPVSHSLRAFNVLAEANGLTGRKVSSSDIEFITAERRLPEPLANEHVDERRAKPVLFRRAAGPARITLFDGGHESDVGAAVRWLEQFKR